MAEIKQNFSEGKMNKDLDERLLPKGQYRHAENIQVSTSEESDVGAIENVLSNTLLSENFVPEDSVCVGRYADEKNNSLYWFVTSPSKDMILQWLNSEVTPVLVDLKVGTVDAVLKFNSENIITGINVIDNLLFWTDGHNNADNKFVGTEPKKINIDFCIQGTIDKDTHTKLIVPDRDIDLSSNIDIREEHITVIKKSPKTKLQLQTEIDQVTTAEITADFMTIPPAYSSSTISAQVGDTVIVPDPFSNNYNNTFGISNFIGQTYFEPGDELFIIRNISGTTSLSDLPDVYDVRVRVIANLSGQSVDNPPTNYTGPTNYQANTYSFEILQIKGSNLSPLSSWFVYKKMDSTEFFEKQFASFSYRYKYQDGEYSTFAPFSDIAFSPGKFDYETKKAYNLGMENKIKSLSLTDFVNSDVLEDVVQIDLLYKDSSSPKVYIVDKIKFKDPKTISLQTGVGQQPVMQNNWEANRYDVISDTIYSLLPSNQLIRPFDNLPKVAKAQEITGSRIVYGNYKQNYNLEEKPIISANYILRSNTNASVDNPQKSLKSARNYQLGIVYLDEYGRQTPVFSNSNSSFNIPKNQAINSNAISFTPLTQAPDWARFYKVYVKETSNEYYNLAMDRVYKAKDGNAWLSFPSSERNKIDEETFLILKKQLDADFQVEDNLKYKIIAIEDNAPIEVKSNFVFLSDSNGTGDIENLFTGETPQIGSSEFQIDEATFKADGGPSIDNITDTLGIKFKDTSENITSEFYEIANVEFEAPFFNIKLKEKIRESDKWIYSNFATLTNFEAENLSDNLSLRFYKDERKEQPEFDGKFFVKILNDYATEQFVFKGAYATQEYASAAYLDAFYLSDTAADYSNSILPSGTTGNVSSSGNFASDTRGDWVNNCLQFNNNSISSEWFIDQVHYQSKHPDNNDLMSSLNPNLVSGNFVMKPEFEGGYGKGIYKDPSTDQWFMELSFSKILPDAEYKFQNNSLLPGMPPTLNVASLEKPELFAVGSIINQNHVDQNDIVRNLTKNKIFRFVGDSRNSKYIINEDVVVEKRYNYKSFADLQNYFQGPFQAGLTNSTNPGGTNIVYTQISTILQTSFGQGLENEWDSFSEAVNRRITYIIPFALHSDNPTLDSNGNPIYAQADPLANSEFVSSGGSAYSNVLDTTNGADQNTPQAIQFLELDENEGDQLLSSNPAIWETEPKENIDLDIYYEASDCYDISSHGQSKILDWFNCYSFGNGVESDRIRDDFNQVRIGKGAVASSTIDFVYEEEHRKNGLIYSGVYNSTSGVNNLNQFIQAEKITKDLNPTYGSIQKLFSRNTDLITFCEDKVIKVLANKDAVFNADGNPQLIASQNVLGQTVPYVGDYGISKNPESFAKESYRAYFTDKNRGKVLRLSRDGITPISEYGMSKYFKDNLKNQDKIIGSYDQKKNEYNLTLQFDTISYDEKVKGWSSFKSFVPEQGVSVTNFYYTFKNGNLYKHHDDVITSFNSEVTYNNFYGVQYDTKVTTILNDSPSFIKSFKTINYEGSQSNVIENLSDNNYYNLSAKDGWKLDKINTDKESGFIPEFISKEGKWFNNLKGQSISSKEEIDVKSFNFQGVGFPSKVEII